MAKLTFENAVRKWVDEFNAIPQELIRKAYGWEVFELEITPLDKKYTCDCCVEEFSFEEYEDAEEDAYGEKICPSCEDEDGKIIEEEDYDNYESGLPMWGTMWTFGSMFDEEWAIRNLEVMKECGFRIYQSEELGIFFGIDGAGYSFFEEHWKALYLARGLRWHNEAV